MKFVFKKHLFVFILLILVILIISPLVFSKTWKILPLGNSNTVGVGNPSYSGGKYCHNPYSNCVGYRLQLKNLLTAEGISSDFVGTKSMGGFSDNQHAGYSGKGIGYIQGVVSGGIISNTNPDIVLLMIGANDMWVSVSDDRSPISDSKARFWGDQLGVLIDSIYTKKPSVAIIVAKPTTPGNSQRPVNIFRAKIDTVVATRKSQGKKIYVIDCAGASNDGVHFTPSGFNTLASRWFNEIKKIVSVDDVPVIPSCTSNNWSSSDGDCKPNGKLTRTWTKSGTCTGGITHPTTEEINCNYVPPVCSSFVYGGWSVCSYSGVMYRDVVSSSPSGCVGGNPKLVDSCVFIPVCSSSNWNYSDGECGSNNLLTRTWSKIGSCSGGEVHPEFEMLGCGFYKPMCVDFVYGDWSECYYYGEQNRTFKVLNEPCKGQPENLTNPCTPECIYQYTGWGECINGNQYRNATALNQPCIGNPINLTKNCGNPCTENDYSYYLEPRECPKEQTQTKRYYRLTECYDVNNPPTDQTITCTYYEPPTTNQINQPPTNTLPQPEENTPDLSKCEGTTCNNICYNEKGICCNNIWNPNFNTCEFNYDQELEQINKTSDKEAIQLIATAINAGEKGDLLKANAYKNLSIIKTQLNTIGNPIDLIEQYQKAKTATQNQNYQQAQLIIEEINQNTIKNNNDQPDILFITIITLTIISIIIIATKILKKKPINSY
ncbi:MAG TPA: GDSL-type esterase/lipase family protein [archaeon]|nr:GDSL-type esterase/lipase family protein [archaeon]